MSDIMKPTVFVSFNNGSKDFVDSLESRLAKGATIRRFEDEVPAWGSFVAFMDSIKEQDFAVLVISDAYLKSYACMYEVIQVMQNPQWKDKTLFALMSDTKPYTDAARISYIKHWTDKCNTFQLEIEDLPITCRTALNEKLSRMFEIRDAMDAFLDAVADSNCPPLYNVIQEICDKVKTTKQARFSVTMADGSTISMKSWLILDALQAKGPMNATELSAHLGLSRSTTQRLIKDLVNNGKIERYSSLRTTKYRLHS